VPRKEFWQARQGHVRQPAEDIGKPCLRVHIVHFGGDDQGVHEGGTVTAARRSGEEPGFPPEGNSAQGAFSGIIG
jgi:hypothetical protein